MYIVALCPWDSRVCYDYFLSLYLLIPCICANSLPLLNLLGVNTLDVAHYSDHRSPSSTHTRWPRVHPIFVWLFLQHSSHLGKI